MYFSSTDIADLRTNLSSLQQRIELALHSAGRSRDELRLVAVSKTQHPEVIEAAFEAGLRDFGENRVQELIKKRELLSTQIRWHLVGHLQSNKAKYIAPFITLVHSIDSIDTAIELSRRAAEHDRTIDILIEVNIARDPAKHGVEPDRTQQLIESIALQAQHLRIIGLMTVAPFEEHPENTRPYFRALEKLRNELSSRFPEIPLRELSMGMSNDFEVAIQEGATLIRIGSALFGERL
jgi:pyridoxal phosphate enzyme (YggS family)